MMKLLFLMLFALGAFCGEENKRDISLDPGKLPVLAGGGKLPSRRDQGNLRSLLLEEGSGQTELLELDAAPGSLPESYTFLTDPTYRACYSNEYDFQGSCNTCWAFATAKMVQARNCKWATDKNEKYPLTALSPLNLICRVQDKVNGLGVCDSKAVTDALELAKSSGVIRSDFVHSWVWAPLFGSGGKGDLRSLSEQSFMDHFESLSTDVKTVGPSLAERLRRMVERESVTDLTRPTDKNCRDLFRGNRYVAGLVHAPRIFVSAPPHTSDRVKRRILTGGPVIGIIRLTWEFLTHTGSLFNPRGRQTFCRSFQLGDKEDFCDPQRESEWDQMQKDQQMRPAGMSRDDFMDTWYNHFVVIHGWGTSKDGVRYWSIENSWGKIYKNDVDSGNNGAGDKFPIGQTRSAFTTIADNVAGRGGLEFISREVYSAGP